MIYFMVMFYVLDSLILYIYGETIISVGLAKIHVRKSTRIYVSVCASLWHVLPLLLTICCEWRRNTWLGDVRSCGDVLASPACTSVGTSLADDGTQCLGWYQGKGKKNLNAKTRRVRIEWDESCLGEDDVRVLDHKLIMGNWNPKNAKKGGWREFLSKK